VKYLKKKEEWIMLKNGNDSTTKLYGQTLLELTDGFLQVLVEARKL
jgi:hypothetical protein